MYPGNKYKLNNMTEEVEVTEFNNITVSAPVNGYIKIKNSIVTSPTLG